jgi:hypothetical protein
MNTHPWRNFFQKIRCSLKYFNILLNYVQYCPFLDFADTYDEAYATFGVRMWRFLKLSFLVNYLERETQKIPYYFLD